MKKKLLAILLAALMVMTLLPTVAFAEKTEINEVTVSLAYDFDEKTMTFTPAAGDEGKYAVPDTFTVDAFDKDGNLLYEYSGSGDGSKGEWYDSVDEEIQASNVDMTAVSFLVYECMAIVKDDYSFNTEGLVVNVNGVAFEKIVRGDDEDATSSGYEADDDYLRIYIREDLSTAPSTSKGAEIKGTITPADFSYSMVIPASTLLTEGAHKDVLLGTTATTAGDGIVTIEVTKHDCATIDVFYTVDLANGTLTDGTTTITTNYGISDAADGEFAALAEETQYTVYTGGTVKNTYVNVSADETSWNNAPVGDYNATVVFNFDDAEVATVAWIIGTVDGGFPDQNGSPAAPNNAWKAGSDKLYLSGSGHNVLYFDSTGIYVNVSATAQKDSSGNYVYTTTNSNVITFNMTEGKLTSVTQSYGETTLEFKPAAN